MLKLIEVKCRFCNKHFYKDQRHFNWNRKLGHNSFCSKQCESEFRKNGKWLTCSNKDCKKGFYRILSGVSPFNYCSMSCAAIINNQKYPKWPIKYCKKCEKPFRREGSPYCSEGCGKLGRFKYTKEELLNLIQKYYKELGRVPARREVIEISYKATHLFGSWNNAVSSAGLEPNRSHDNRMYKRSKTKAADGHLCDSISEAIIDNWLTQNNISHKRDMPYPNTNHKADWAIRDGKTFIEYFGLSNDSLRYDRTIKKKQSLCKDNKIKLIEIYPQDLYPKVLLDSKLSKFI